MIKIFNAYCTSMKDGNHGVWIDFQQDAEKVFTSNGISPDEYRITHYETNINGLSAYLKDNEEIDGLRKLAKAIEKLSDYEADTYSAVITTGLFDYRGIESLIFLASNIQKLFQLLPAVATVQELGRYYVFHENVANIADNIKPHILFDKWGAKMHSTKNGTFTKYGYLLKQEKGNESA